MLQNHNNREAETIKVDATISYPFPNGDAITVVPSLAQSGGSDHSIDRLSDPPKMSRLSGLTRLTKRKAKGLFKGKGANEEGHLENEKVQVMDDIEHCPAFNPSQLVKKTRMSASGAADKTLGTLQSASRSIMHPKDAIKSKATKTTAGQLSKIERPYLSQKSDLAFLQAHDDLKRAEGTSPSGHAISDKEMDFIIGKHKGRIRDMEAYRESLRAAWTTSRHIRRVRVVPKRHLNFPENQYFVERDKEGNFLQYGWLRWLGYNLIYYTQDFSAQYIDEFDELPFNVDSSRHCIERLVMASAPWQSWAMNVRAVYRWENPRITGQWFALYLVLWYMQNVMGFLYAYIIYIVLKNRLYPTSAESLRSSMQRTHDSRSKAHKFGELVDKHGRHNWLEPVIKDLGPYIQLQLGDMANMLEVFSNFYHWKNARKTASTLSFFVSCLLVTLLADMAFCMKIVWFIAGNTFFLCWPIASLYPRYRYLVSPLKWALWDIPTHAEWSLQYLRRQAQIARENMIKAKIEESYARKVTNLAIDKHTCHLTTVPSFKVDGSTPDEEDGADTDSGSGWQSASSTTSVLDASDIRSFRVRCDGVIGRLIISSNGVRFVRILKRKELWRILFIELTEMRKMEGSRVSRPVLLSDQLEIRSIEGKHFIISGMKERDEVFNNIIGFSGLQWQSLQTQHDTYLQAAY